MMSDRDFLKISRPIQDQNLFAVGTFERGITVYRQQIRALNLIYAMEQSKRDDSYEFPPGTQIGIIGGGVFGVTAAAAAAYARFNVFLFEERQGLMPLQRGCDTRWIHPRYYDWPETGSEIPSARLPFLDWQAGTAGQVAAQIEERFREIAAEHQQCLKYFLDVSELKIRTVDDGFEITYIRPSDQRDLPVTAIICAVGFGTELGTPTSYWRNDELSQTRMGLEAGEKAAYVVSGAGDGGLTDVFRLTIHDFRHEHIFAQLFGDAEASLLEKLREIQKSAPPTQDNWLYDQFSNLAGDDILDGPLAEICRRLQKRKRNDTTVILNGKEPSLRACLKLGRISFSNALLAYLLQRTSILRYEGGELNVSNLNEPKLADASGVFGEVPWGEREYVIRHGTDREGPFKRLGLARALGELRKHADSGVDTGKKIYPDGWWSKYTSPIGSRRSGMSTLPAPIEYVPAVTIIQGTTFISTLADILADVSRRRGAEVEFRMTLHRLAFFNGADHFQQVTEYAGRITERSGLGRFFPIWGIVGLACRTGSLVVARQENEEQFAEVWKLTRFEELDARKIQPYVQALVACPFFAPPSQPQADYVTMVLFADSADRDFFDDEVLRLISAACTGFVSNLEELCSKGAIVSASSDYHGYRVRPEAETSNLVAQLKTLGVAFDDANFGTTYKQQVTFKTVRSFDLEVGAPRKVQPLA